MIRVEKNGDIITIKGHANFDEYGKDIVCASVSSIIYTTVNGIFCFDNDAIDFIDDKVMIIKVLRSTKEVNILIDSMFNLLKDLEKQYPKNIKISKGD